MPVVAGTTMADRGAFRAGSDAPNVMFVCSNAGKHGVGIKRKPAAATKLGYRPLDCFYRDMVIHPSVEDRACRGDHTALRDCDPDIPCIPRDRG